MFGQISIRHVLVNEAKVVFFVQISNKAGQVPMVNSHKKGNLHFFLSYQFKFDIKW